MNANYIEGSSSDSDDSMKTNHARQAPTPIANRTNILDLLSLQYGDDMKESGDAEEKLTTYVPELPVYGPERLLIPHNETTALDLTDSPIENNHIQQQEATTVVTLDSSRKKVEWVEKILIPKNTGMTYETRGRSPTEFDWRQALWSTLVIITPTAKTVDLFVGYDRPDLIPRGWSLNTSFRFSLLDREGNVIKQSDPITHCFSVPYKSNQVVERADRGLKNMFDYETFMSHIYPLEDSAAEYGTVDIKVTLPYSNPNCHRAFFNDCAKSIIG